VIWEVDCGYIFIRIFGIVSVVNGHLLVDGLPGGMAVAGDRLDFQPFCGSVSWS